MIFDHPPAELPVATLRPRELGPQLLLDARAWLAEKWSWLRPRWIPVAVAITGMFGVIAAANYLRDFARQSPEQLEYRYEQREERGIGGSPSRWRARAYVDGATPAAALAAPEPKLAPMALGVEPIEVELLDSGASASAR